MARNIISIANTMRRSPAETGDIHSASLTRRAAYLPFMAGSIIGIADAMRSSSEMVDDMYIASLARRAVDLPRKAGITGQASPMRCSIHLTWQVAFTQRHFSDAPLTCLMWQVT